MSALLPLGDVVATQLLQSMLWSRGAIERVAPVRSALFPAGSLNIVPTPGANSITMEIESSRTTDRAGLDSDPNGAARWAPRGLMTWYPRSTVASETIVNPESDALHDWDVDNIGNMDARAMDAAAVYLRNREGKIRNNITTAHARFWERNLLKTIYGPDLDFTSTGFTSRLATALPAAMGLGGLTLASTAFNIPAFARGMKFDLRLQTSGASDRVGGAVWVLTPALAAAWSRNTSLLGIIPLGDAAAGYTAVNRTPGEQVLNDEEIVRRLTTLDGVAKVVIADGFADVSALGSSTASNDYLVGSRVGLGIIVQEEDKAIVNPRTSRIERRATGLIEQVHFEGAIRAERHEHQGWMYYADASIGHTVVDEDFGEIIYDAA